MELARTSSFVPGKRPERFAKALACGADVLVPDLEDAVADEAKAKAKAEAEARSAIADWQERQDRQDRQSPETVALGHAMTMGLGTTSAASTRLTWSMTSAVRQARPAWC